MWLPRQVVEPIIITLGAPLCFGSCVLRTHLASVGLSRLDLAQKQAYGPTSLYTVPKRIVDDAGGVQVKGVHGVWFVWETSFFKDVQPLLRLFGWHLNTFPRIF